jgi:tetratricopeptide (TPR) repeat protein
MIFIPTGFVACGFSTPEWELKKAEKAEKENRYQEAIQFYYKYLRKNVDNQKSIEPALKIYQISSVNLPNPSLIEKSLKHIILRSDDEKQRMDAQFKLGNHYFDNVNDYESAIAQFNRFIALSKRKHDNNLARLKVAKSYFYLNNFYQAKVEIDDILSNKPDSDLKFDTYILKASVLQSEKLYKEAAEVYEKLFEEFPAKSEKEQVYLNLAIVYQDNKDFNKAIETLKKYRDKHNNPEFIDEKIKAIRFTLSQQPGARGRVK